MKNHKDICFYACAITSAILFVLYIVYMFKGLDVPAYVFTSIIIQPLCICGLFNVMEG